jgi:hypothetical protein
MKMNLPKIAALALLASLPPAARAQDTPDPNASPTPTNVATRFPIWRCTLPGGTYEVALRSIISVSTHEYIVDGIARVTEMNIDTAGSLSVRFYYLEPMTPQSPVGIGQSTIDKVQELAQEAAGRVSPDSQPPWEKVVKNYPTTTHAHTIEYRLDTLDQLNTLFKSADQAFRQNLNTQITLP